jgi:hypothetical protein
MTEQEIFDTVVKHLATQGRRAADDEGRCRYRAPDGAKCAVGCLLTDEEYNPAWEGEVVDNARLPPRFADSLAVWGELQSAHDHSSSVEDLHEKLGEIADKHSLDATLVETVTRWS